VSHLLTRFKVAVVATVIVCGLHGQQPPQNPTNPSAQPDPTQQPYPILDSTFATYHGVLVPSHTEYAGPNTGKVVPDGCVFRVHLDANEKAIEARQIGPPRRNSDTDCEADFVVGVPTQSPPPASGVMRQVSRNAPPSSPGSGIPAPPGLGGGPAVGTVPAQVPSPNAAKPGSLRRRGGDIIRLPRPHAPEPRADGLTPKLLCWPPIDCYAPYQSLAQGYGYSYVLDPARITVNSVTSQIWWYYSAFWQLGCAFDGSGYDTTTAFWPTSWFLYSDVPADYSYCTDDGMGGYIEDSYTAIVDYAIFENPVFCAFTTTWAEYYPQEVDGNSDGTMDGWYDSYIFGSPCSGWLTPQAMQLRRNQ